jgi:hypothetical protein
MCVFACISMVIYVPETWRQTKTNKGQSIKSANGQGIFKPLPCSLSVAEMLPVAVIRSQGISKQINARNHARFNQFNPFCQTRKNVRNPIINLSGMIARTHLSWSWAGMIFDWLYHIFPGTDPTPAPYETSPRLRVEMGHSPHHLFKTSVGWENQASMLA